MLSGAFANIPGWGIRNAFDQLNLMRKQMDLLSGTMFGRRPLRRFVPSGVFPAINLTENEDNYFMRAELPGLNAEDLNIQVVGRTLTLSGERRIAAEDDDVRYHRREREAGRFSRGITLPGDIDAERIAARMTNGLLTLTIAKAEAAKPRKIAVN